MNITRATTWTLLAVLIGVIGRAAAPRPAPETPHLALFKDWLPATSITSTAYPGGSDPDALATSTAFDTLGNIHIVRASSITPSNVVYSRTNADPFGAFLLADPVVLGSGFNAKVSVTPDGKVHATWIGNVSATVTGLYYALNDGSGWTAPALISPAPTFGGSNLNHHFITANLHVVDAAGQLHLVSGNETSATFSWVDQGTTFDYIRLGGTVLHALAGSPLAVVPGTESDYPVVQGHSPGEPNDQYGTSGGYPTFAALNLSGSLFLAWIERLYSAAIIADHHFSNDGVWGGDIDVTGGYPSAYALVDDGRKILTDSQFHRHAMAINFGPSAGPGYCIDAVAPDTSMVGALFLDSHDRPHVVAGATHMIGLPPAPGSPPAWITGFLPFTAPPIQKVIISPDDHVRIFATTFATDPETTRLAPTHWHSRTYTLGVGVVDSAAYVPVLPGGALHSIDGNFMWRLPLFSASGVGPCQAFALTYNSLDPFPGSLPPGWKHNYEVRIIDHRPPTGRPGDPPLNGSNRLSILLPDGRPAFAFYDPFYGYFYSYDGINAKIERFGSTPEALSYRLTDKFGTVNVFNRHGQLTRIEDLSGNATELAYDDIDHRLLSVTDQNGARTTTLSYAGAPAPDRLRSLSSIHDPAGKVYSFGVTVDGSLHDHLDSISFSSGPGSPTHSFLYDACGIISRYTTPRGHPWNLGCDSDHRVSEVHDPVASFVTESDPETGAPSGTTAAMTMSYADPIPVLPDYVIQNSLVDRRGFETRFRSNYSNLVEFIQDKASIDGVLGISPILRGFNGVDNVSLTDVSDRWGAETYTEFDFSGIQPYVFDNVFQVYRPDPATGGADILVAEFTYTSLSRVATATSYVDGTGRTTTYGYNGFGQLTSIQHPDVLLPDGSTQSASAAFEYDGPYRTLSRSINEEGHATVFSNFDPLTSLPRAVLRAGGSNPATMAYDLMGNVTHSTAPASGSPPPGAPASDAPAATVYHRDGLYRVDQVTDPLGKITTYQFDLDSNVVQTNPPAGDPSTTSFDARGNATSGLTPDGSWSVAVDANGNVRRSTDLRGFTSFSTYDFMGRTVLTKSPGASTLGAGMGGGGPDMVTLMEHDLFDGSFHFSQTTQDPAGAEHRVSRSYFDLRGRTIRAIEPDLATVREMFYDEQDQVLASQILFNDALQTCSLTFRDARDRVIGSRTQDAAYGGSPTKQKTTWTFFNRVGSVVKSVDPLGDPSIAGNLASPHATLYVHDARERVIRVKDAYNRTVSETDYGDDDLAVETRVPDPATKSEAMVRSMTYAYTARKELKADRDLENHGRDYVYNDLPGQVATVTDPLTRVTRTLYDPSTQRAVEVIEAEGTADQNRTLSTWEQGLLTETRVHNPQTGLIDAAWKRYYDRAGRLERFESPDNLIAAERTAFTAFSEVSDQVLGSEAIHHLYDALGRNYDSTWSGPRAGHQSKTFNGIGQLTLFNDGPRTKRMDYELWRGTPTREDFDVENVNWEHQVHDHDLAGNYSGLEDPEGVAQAWPVDANNRPTQEFYQGKVVREMSYTPGGLLDTEILYDALEQPIARITHFYDSLGRQVRSRTLKIGSNEVLSDYAWTYNAAHEIVATNLNHLGAIFTIGNDDRGQLKTETTPGNGGGLTPPPFSNDVSGTPTGLVSVDSNEAEGTPHTVLAVPPRSASYQYAPNGHRIGQVIDGIGVSLHYNAAGQLLEERNALTNELLVSHEYDEWGNEISRTEGGLTETYGYNHLNLLSVYTKTGGTLWQYDYWPSGERAAKTDQGGPVAQSELYIPRNGDVVTDYTQAGAGPITLQNSYVQGTGMDVKSTRVPASGERRHYIGNMVGTVGMTLNDTGSPEPGSTNVRDAWGVQIAGGSAERYGFAQREHDSESGLVFMRARQYDPRIGRFTQAEPITHLRADESYKYASNRPSQVVDPSGRVAVFVGGWEGTVPALGQITALDKQCLYSLYQYLSQSGPFTQKVGKTSVFSWSDLDSIEKEIILEVRKNPDQPVVLVGYSFGGDAVVQVADRLRKVNVRDLNGHLIRNSTVIDVLVTIDAISGFYSSNVAIQDDSNIIWSRNYYETNSSNIITGARKVRNMSEPIHRDIFLTQDRILKDFGGKFGDKEDVFHSNIGISKTVIEGIEGLTKSIGSGGNAKQEKPKPTK